MDSAPINIRRNSRFYFNTLDEVQKKVYNEIKKAVESYRASIMMEVPVSAKPADFVNLVNCVGLDNPLLYYLNSIDISVTSGAFSNHLVITLNYNYTKKEVENNLMRIEKKVSEIYYDILSDKKTDYEKEKALHDYLIKNVFYHLKAPADQKNEYTVIGPLFSGYGVCKGFAQTMNLIMNSIGIKCSTIAGYSKVNGEAHAWNIIKIGGSYYHLDTTWDLNLSEGILHYDYFNITDTACRIDHDWSVPTDCGSETDNYFVRTGRCVADKQDIYRLLGGLMRDGDGVSMRIVNGRITPPDILERVSFNNMYCINERQNILTIIRK